MTTSINNICGMEVHAGSFRASERIETHTRTDKRTRVSDVDGG